MANTLGAKNDLEAVSAWLSRYNEKPSTQRSYRKETERFLLWCAQELKKPLSSVNAPDCQKYREFLQAVPATWINDRPCKRTDPRWRAFRSLGWGSVVAGGRLMPGPRITAIQGRDVDCGHKLAGSNGAHAAYAGRGPRPEARGPPLKVRR